MSGDQSRVRAVFEGVKAAGRTVLTAPEAREVCEAYGLPVPKEGLARSIEEAARLAREIGFPVAMKIVSPDIVHKTEAGGVQLGLSNTREVRQAYRTITANAWNYQLGRTNHRRAGPTNGHRRQRSDRWHDPRSGLRPRGHVRPGWDLRRNAAGYDLPSGADDARRSAPDARRRPGCGASARRSRVAGGQSGGAGGLDRQGIPIGGGFP